MIMLNGDSPIVIEARAIRHARPFTLPVNTDEKWLVAMDKDVDGVAVDSDNTILKHIRLMGPTQWCRDSGDKIAFRGFAHFGQVDGSKSDVNVFKLDTYLSNLSVMRKGDDVQVLFNIPNVIDGHNVTSIKGTVSYVGPHMVRITVGKEEKVLDFCTSDISVNDFFVYGPRYEGEKYSKRSLFNKNWMFVIEEDFVAPNVLASWVFPTISEGFDVFPESSGILNLWEAEKLTGERIGGRKTYAAIRDAIKKNIRVMKENKKIPVRAVIKKGTRFNVSPGMDMLHFHKNGKVFTKYFNQYIHTDKFVDGDQSRFEHISRNRHMMYSYCLNLLLKSYPKTFSKPKEQNTSTSSNGVIKFDEHRHGLPKTDLTFNNMYDMLMTRAPNGTTALLFGHSRAPAIYKMTDDMWCVQQVQRIDGVVPPGCKFAVDLDVIDEFEKHHITETSRRIVDDVESRVGDIKDDLGRDIVVQMNLGKYHKGKQFVREMVYKEEIDYDKMDGSEDDIDIDEIMNNAEVFGENGAILNTDEMNYDAPEIDETLAKMLEEPVGETLKILIELLGVSIETKDIRIMLYTMSKYNSFHEIRKNLQKKERDMKAQVAAMKKKLNKTELDAVFKQYLQKQERAFMTEYYGVAVSLSCALIVIYVHMHLPTITIRPMNSLQSCFKSFSYMGYPINEDKDKSLIKYMACVLDNQARNSAEDTPLKLASEHFKKSNLEESIHSHIENILDGKPHYVHRLRAARRLVEKKKAEATKKLGSSRIFYGFKPEPDHIRERFQKVQTTDLMMFNNSVNSCCVQNIDVVMSKDYVVSQNVFRTTSSKLLKHSSMQRRLVVDDMHRIVAQENVKIVSMDENGGEDDVTLQGALRKFCDKNPFFRNDNNMKLLCDVKDVNDAWNALSIHVKMNWQYLINLLRPTTEQVNVWSEVFINQEERYRNPSEVKAVFERVVRTTIPMILSRATNDYRIDTRAIDKKTFIPLEGRKVVKSMLLDKETEALKTLLDNDEDDVMKTTIHDMVYGCFNDVEILRKSSNTSEVYRVILAYNYVILKVLFMTLCIALMKPLSEDDDVFNQKEQLSLTNTPRMKAMSEIVKSVMDKICKTMETNHVDTSKIKLEHEKQREQVKQELMKKMERFGKDERMAFKVLKEKTGYSNDYLDKIQNQGRDLLDMLNREENPNEGGRESPTGEDIEMVWEGENPDDIELEDDGRGY